MGNKKDILPIITASVIALVVTGIVRWMLPGGTVIKQETLKKELSLPDIPLMVKNEKKRVIEVMVAVTSTAIKKDEKIDPSKITWKKWPADAIQPYFIAKDNKETPLNNGADYSNALKMWAKNDIPTGIPLVMSMLTNENPVLVAEKLKKVQEEKAKEEKQKEEDKKRKKDKSIIRAGYRAITFPIDQKATASSSMIAPGNLIDVIINEYLGQKMKTHTYRALKIVAVDGKTAADYEAEAKRENESTFGSLNVSKFFAPKSITLEVKADKVNVMLKQLGNNGIILSLRNQDEKVAHYGEEDDGEEDSVAKNALINEILEMNRVTSAEILLETKRKKEEEEKNLSLLMKNMNELGSKGGLLSANSSEESSESGKYEVASGRIIGDLSKDEEKEEKEEKKEIVRIYRKLTPDAVEFDKNGKKVLGVTMSSPSYGGTK